MRGLIQEMGGSPQDLHSPPSPPPPPRDKARGGGGRRVVTDRGRSWRGRISPIRVGRDYIVGGAGHHVPHNELPAGGRTN